MSVIVTGCAGFIGSNLVPRLLGEGLTVVCVDNLYSGSWSNIAVDDERVVRVTADVSDLRVLRESLSRVVRAGDVESVIHLAAIVGVEEAARDPGFAVRVNVGGTANVLEEAVRLGADRVVLASSAAVYGEPVNLPIREDHPLQPINVYGETKVAAERLLWLYHRLYGVKGVALRIFNAYGPRMRPGPYASVVYKLVEAALRGGKFVVYGDGTQTRDFIYVSDVVDALVKALSSNYVGPANVGSGVETSIIRLHETLCRATGLCPQLAYGPPRKGDVRRSVASIELSSEALGWRPRISLDEGLRRTLNYYKTLWQPS